MSAPKKIYLAIPKAAGISPIIHTYSPRCKMLNGDLVIEQFQFPDDEPGRWCPVRWVAEYELKRQFTEADKNEA